MVLLVALPPPVDEGGGLGRGGGGEGGLLVAVVLPVQEAAAHEGSMVSEAVWVKRDPVSPVAEVARSVMLPDNVHPTVRVAPCDWALLTKLTLLGQEPDEPRLPWLLERSVSLELLYATETA